MKEPASETTQGSSRVIHDDLSIRSVVNAWHRVGGQTPTSVELLKSKRGQGSAVYSLSNGSSNVRVIAKGTEVACAVAEATIYQDVLADVPAAGLEFLGYSVAASGAYAFVFLEDAGDLPPDGGNSEHAQVVGRWLATLHMSTARRSRPRSVPTHGVSTYERYRRSGLDHLDKALRIKGLESRQTAILQEAIRLFRQVALYLPLIDHYVTLLPPVLVHGDLVPDNMRIRNTCDVLVFDWEMGGWGPPTTDLATLRTYYGRAGWSAYKRHMLSGWDAPSVEALDNAAVVGRILRLTAEIYWKSIGLSSDRDDPQFEFYVRSNIDHNHARMVPRLANAVRDLSLRK